MAEPKRGFDCRCSWTACIDVSDFHVQLAGALLGFDGFPFGYQSSEMLQLTGGGCHTENPAKLFGWMYERALLASPNHREPKQFSLMVGALHGNSSA